ncbi:MAG: alpha-amylase family glycosyl hydrolase [Desulfobacterales bacterium]
MDKRIDAIRSILEGIYGPEKGRSAFEEIWPLIDGDSPIETVRGDYFSQEDAILITYGHSLRKEGRLPLDILDEFANQFLKDHYSTIHILPFFPFSSDDGFSVIDYYDVDPSLGSWEQIQRMREEFKLMFDLVLNHVSAESKWFKAYLNEKAGFEDLAIQIDSSMDISNVVRPRTLPLGTDVTTASGATRRIWTTFSPDQIDLNYDSIGVLKRIIGVLIFYLKQGATDIRLDAIAYLWKESGSSCIHLPQAHGIVKLFRRILDILSPTTRIITETNVPHDENIRYFGDGQDEAQLVYNFTLPPLLLHAFIREDATALSTWAAGLTLASESNTFLNFTASHDGIGVRPLEGILPRAEIALLARRVRENGGHVSEYQSSDGSRPYELNITYIDALLFRKDVRDDNHVARFLSSQAISFALPGVPATYINSLLGCRNWEEGVKQTGRARSINRESVAIDAIMSDLDDPGTFSSKIMHPYLAFVRIRRKQAAFHPNASFDILSLDPRVFAIKRSCDSQCIYALSNISSRPVSVSLTEKGVAARLQDLLTEEIFITKDIHLRPYQFVWLSQEG